MTLRHRALPLLAFLLASNVALAETVYGTLGWANITTLSTPLSGRISTVKVSEGDRIKKGQLLASLDPRLYQAALKRAQAQLQSVQSRFDDVEREYTRAKELFERTVLSQTDLQAAEVKFLSTQAELHQAQAELEQAKIEREYTQLRAPFNGIVVERNINPHETVSNALQVTPMLRVSPGKQPVATFRIGHALASGILPGSQLQLNTESGSLTARVSQLESDANATLITVELPQSNAQEPLPAYVSLELPQP